MKIDRVIAKGQLVPLLFAQDAVADAQSAVAMNIMETTATMSTLPVTSYRMPWGGQIVAISIMSSEARTAGTLTVDATIGGTVTGMQAALDATNTTTHHARQPRDSDRFVPGGLVGVKLTTSSWTPVTADVAVVVWVLLELEGI